MDPYSLVKVLWRHRLLALPVVILVLLGAGYVVLLGPRTYEASAVYVIVNPDQPTERELERNARLARLNSNNPYLRSSDQSLIAKVLISRMSSKATQLALEAQSLSPDYTIAQSPLSEMTLVITAAADSGGGALATRQWLLDDLQKQLYELQKVNGADDRYLFRALPVDVSATPEEKISSRLRSLILVLAAGVVLIIGVVSIGVANEKRRADALDQHPAAPTGSAPPPPGPGDVVLGVAGSTPTRTATAVTPSVRPTGPPPAAPTQAPAPVKVPAGALPEQPEAATSSRGRRKATQKRPPSETMNWD